MDMLGSMEMPVPQTVPAQVYGGGAPWGPGGIRLRSVGGLRCGGQKGLTVLRWGCSALPCNMELLESGSVG